MSPQTKALGGPGQSGEQRENWLHEAGWLSVDVARGLAETWATNKSKNPWALLLSARCAVARVLR